MYLNSYSRTIYYHTFPNKHHSYAYSASLLNLFVQSRDHIWPIPKRKAAILALPKAELNGINVSANKISIPPKGLTNLSISIHTSWIKPTGDEVDRASATETVDSGSIPGRFKPKTITIGIHSFPAWRSAIQGTVWSLHRVWLLDRWLLDPETKRPLRWLLV